MAGTSIPVWPRLDPGQTEAEYEILLVSDVAQATRMVNLEVGDLRFYETGSNRVTKSRLEDLRSEVLGLARLFNFPHDRDTQRVPSFDQELAALFFTSMPMLEVEAANTDVWNFVTLRVLPDVAIWRWPAKNPASTEDGGQKTPQHRLRIPRRNVFRQAWVRQNLLGPEACRQLDEDTFVQLTDRLTIIGDQVFGGQVVAKVLNARQNDSFTREVLRQFLKLVGHLCGRIALDTLSHDQIDCKLQECLSQATELASNIRTGYSEESHNDTTEERGTGNSDLDPAQETGGDQMPQIQPESGHSPGVPPNFKHSLSSLETSFLDHAYDYRDYLIPMLGPCDFEEACALLEEGELVIQRAAEPLRARALLQNLTFLVESWVEYRESELSIIAAALRYFLAEEDAISDSEPGGLTDDEAVIAAAFSVLGMRMLANN